MKKIIIYSLLCFVGIFMISCSSSKNVTTTENSQLQPKIQPEQLQPQQLQAEDNYRIWRQKDFRQIRVGDLISFFNNTEIVLYAAPKEEVFQLIDGKVRKVTIPKYVTKTVPIKTPGRLVSMKIIDEIIYEMEIAFSSEDETYLFTFVIATDDSFILHGNAPLIFEGNEYKTTAIVTKTCQLLWDFTEYTDPEYINKEAEGVRIRGERTIIVE